MPKLIALYIRNVLIGFALAAVFVALLLGTNVGNLRHLVFGSDMGVVALLMLFIFNGLVFAGVQFAWVILRMEDRNPPPGGTRAPVATDIPVRVATRARARRSAIGPK